MYILDESFLKFRFVCWDLNNEGKVVVIHDYASVGYEFVKEFNTFWAWFREAIDDMIDFINEDIG